MWLHITPKCKTSSMCRLRRVLKFKKKKKNNIWANFLIMKFHCYYNKLNILKPLYVWEWTEAICASIKSDRRLWNSQLVAHPTNTSLPTFLPSCLSTPGTQLQRWKTHDRFNLPGTQGRANVWVLASETRVRELANIFQKRPFSLIKKKKKNFF